MPYSTERRRFLGIAATTFTASLLAACTKKDTARTSPQKEIQASQIPMPTDAIASPVTAVTHDVFIQPTESPPTILEKLYIELSALQPHDIPANPFESYLVDTIGPTIGYATYHGSEANGADGLTKVKEVVHHQMDIPQWVNVGLLTPEIPDYSGHAYAQYAETVRKIRKAQGLGSVSFQELSKQQKSLFSMPKSNKILVESQKMSNPFDLLYRKEFIGFASTHSPNDIGKEMYVFGKEDYGISFIGKLYITDSPRFLDYVGYHDGQVSSVTNGLARQQYTSYKAILPWIADISHNAFIQLPTGLSGSRENINEGRPGVILVPDIWMEAFYTRSSVAK
jgi:hypothetical protein